VLAEFSVTNFRSLKGRNTISMIAGTDTSHEGDLIVAGGAKRLLPVIAIYGANSAGKSNVLLALKAMQRMIAGDNAPLLNGKRLPYEPFAFDKTEKSVPTEYQIVFYCGGVKYDYSFSHNDKQILNEALYHWPRNRKSLIFSRECSLYVFRENKKEQNVLAGRTPHNRLYLTSSSEWNAPQTKPAFQWLTDKLLTYDDQDATDTKATREIWDLKSELSPRILEELQKADLGISNILDSEILTFLHEFESGGEKHSAALKFLDESKGTQRFFLHIGPWLLALECGITLFVDELEASMHPLLTKRLVEMMQDPEINRNCAQLIFTTHDAMLLDLSLLRRDQIWFAEKDPKTLATELFSLWEFSARKDENILKN
jgi:AAA15 family ATPase/GTPase